MQNWAWSDSISIAGSAVVQVNGIQRKEKKVELEMDENVQVFHFAIVAREFRDCLKLGCASLQELEFSSTRNVSSFDVLSMSIFSRQLDDITIEGNFQFFLSAKLQIFIGSCGVKIVGISHVWDETATRCFLLSESRKILKFSSSQERRKLFSSPHIDTCFVLTMNFSSHFLRSPGEGKSLSSV